MAHELEGFDPTAVKKAPAKLWTEETPTVHASDYARLLALYEMTAHRADASEKKLQHLQAEISHPEFYLRAINCPHSIDAEKVVLYFDPKQEGHNALNQLSKRLTLEPKQVEHTEPNPDLMPPPERQALWVLMDEALANHLGPFERGDICNLLAPVLAPHVSDNPNNPGLIQSSTPKRILPWLDSPLNLDEIRNNALRYLYLRDEATNSNVVSPMVLLINPDFTLATDGTVDGALRYGKPLDHYIDRFLFPKKRSDQEGVTS